MFLLVLGQIQVNMSEYLRSSWEVVHDGFLYIILSEESEVTCKSYPVII